MKRPNVSIDFGKIRLQLLRWVTEILIIIIGIVLGLAVENLKEDAERHERAVEILTSLHLDLSRDLVEMREDSTSLHEKAEIYETLLKMGDGRLSFDPEYVSDNSRALYSTTALIPNTAAYEIIKAHGELDIWQDQHLLMDIFSLYQEALPNLLLQAKALTDAVNNYSRPYLMDNLIVGQGGQVTNFRELLRQPRMRTILMSLAGYARSTENWYGDTMQHYRLLIAQIEQSVGKERIEQAYARPK